MSGAPATNVVVMLRPAAAESRAIEVRTDDRGRFVAPAAAGSYAVAVASKGDFTRTELLLVILGGLLVIEVMSVILQVGFFKLTRGRRLFKMSPIHHHFELLNWAQVTIVMRFWIIAGLCVAAGLGIFYAEWVAGT